MQWMAWRDESPLPTNPPRNARMSRRRLSVVIPTWHLCGLVAKRLKCSVGQEGGDLEVIVVDDGLD